MPSTPIWKLRRLAGRTRRVLTRRAAESPVLVAFAVTLDPAAAAFMGAYDAAAGYEAKWKQEMAEGRGEIGKLLQAMRSWLPLLVRDIPGFDPSDFGDKPDVPDDVIGDAERLEDVVESFKDGDGNALVYQAALLGALDVEAATKEWSEAEDADSKYQKLLSTVRDTAATFDKELQLFRRSFRTIAGSSDKDYQKLRAARANRPDEDDDPSAPAPPPEVTPAPPGSDEPQ